MPVRFKYPNTGYMGRIEPRPWDQNTKDLKENMNTTICSSCSLDFGITTSHARLKPLYQTTIK